MKAERQKIAIYGGSFDPPHYGHYDIVKNLERSFTRVIVVPSYISPFKSDAVGGTDNAKIRLSLCKKLFSSEKTEVSSREINKKGVSYSVDTAAYFAKKYSDAKLTWVIGSEEIKRLSDWHDIDRLKRAVDFLVVPRPGYNIAETDLKALKKLKIRIKLAKFNGLDVSSTAIKIDNAFGKPNKYMPDAVRAAAEKYGIFDPYSKYVKALYRYDLSDKRLSHTYGVALRGAELAKLYGYSVRDAVIACILHDIAKSVNPEEYAGKVDTKGFPPPTVHGPIGAYIAKREFGVSDEIEHAIRYHATGCGEMSPLDEIVYIADKTEVGRSYNEVYYFRYLCEVDKNIAMFTMLNAVSEYKGNLPCELTSAAIAHYKAICGNAEMPEMPRREAGKETGKLPAVRGVTSLGEVKSKAIRPVGEKSVMKISKHDDDENAKAEDAVKQIALAVAAELNLHKAHDIDIIDLSGKTIVADYFVIASATSTTQVKALMGYAEDKLTKAFGIDPIRRDVDSEWIALDYGGVIVHIFTDKTREFYNIERLWSDGANVTRIGD